MKEKQMKMDFNKLKSLTSFYKSTVIILIVLILFFMATSYVFYDGYIDYKSEIRENKFGQKVCLVVTDTGDGYAAGETSFDGYHLSYKFPNEAVTHSAVVVIACLFYPLLDLIMKRRLSHNVSHETMAEKYTFNKILVIVLLIIFLVFFVLSTFYSISYIKYQELVFELPEGSGIYVRPHYTYEITDNGEFVYSGIAYTMERIER